MRAINITTRAAKKGGEKSHRQEVKPSRSGDRQERDELLRVLAESEREVTPMYF